MSTPESGTLKFVYMKLLERPLQVQRQVYKQLPSAASIVTDIPLTVHPCSLEGFFCIMISLQT